MTGANPPSPALTSDCVLPGSPYPWNYEGTDADGSFFWEPGRYRDPANDWPVDAAYGENEPDTGKPLGLTGLIRRHQPDVPSNPRSGWVGDYDIDEGFVVPSGPIRFGRLVQKAFSVSATPGRTPATTPCPSPRRWPCWSAASSATLKVYDRPFLDPSVPADFH
ncbi:hypothetical protein ATKI12_6490 [Kitasatospora sp. Ki12]